MNRLFLYLALVPFFAIGFFYYFGSTQSSTSPLQTSTNIPAEIEQMKIQKTEIRDGRLAKPHRHPDEPSEALKEAIRKSDASSKKLASLLTPELRASMIDGLLNKRSAQYHEFFDSWQIPQSVRGDVLSIVREREMQLSTHRYNLFAKGRASTDIYVANKLFDESLSDMQLEKILGKVRFEAFSKLEDQMFQQEHPKIRSRGIDG